MTRRRKPLGRAPAPPCPLTPTDVNENIVPHASTKPHSPTDNAEFCKAKHPGMPGITTSRVSQLLEWLLRRDRVASWSGGHDAEELEERGVVLPRIRHRYWAVPDERQL